ncbi:NAD-binding protein [Phorcysia thermohydrogeniphila]|uniref:Trk system potassium uptake protein TrkA n=1 Tax=Phorcysia thermohydrogeniphila TaxID=936138 RepID=A0A4R1GBT0_9BACT|nr:NAD-binding protein [Phorcysia thermohydrogeniphila]TCK05248.1 trk system potassium uptake protein TrkA [Phorcysia thermohydrogeniphila]
MKVCIIGAGVVGSYLAKRLSRENHEIAVVDVNADKASQLAYGYDILSVNCDALSVNCLKKVESFELFVVVTESDEKNIAIATLLRSIFGKKRVIVRVSNKAFSSPPVKEFLGCEVVNILSETVQTVLSQIKYPFAHGAVRLESEGIVILKYLVSLNDFLAGKRISELKSVREEVDFTIVAVEREGKVIIPKGESFIFPEDRIYIAVKENRVPELVRALQIRSEPVKMVFVLGYSKFTEELLSVLSDFKGIKVKFFSPDRETCESVSGKFPGVDVFHGEFTDVELLKEEGIGNSDLTVSLSDDEETNILASILAKKLGTKKVCSLILHPEYENIVESIGIDVPLIPRKLLASKVYRQLSRKGFLEVFELSDSLEVVEMTVPKKFSGKTVSELRDSICGLIVAVKKENETKLAKGDTVLLSGETVICIEKRK